VVLTVNWSLKCRDIFVYGLREISTELLYCCSVSDYTVKCPFCEKRCAWRLTVYRIKTRNVYEHRPCRYSKCSSQWWYWVAPEANSASFWETGTVKNGANPVKKGTPASFSWGPKSWFHGLKKCVKILQLDAIWTVDSANKQTRRHFRGSCG